MRVYLREKKPWSAGGGPGRRGMREKAHSRHRPPPEMESKSISNSTSCTHKSYLAPTPRVSLSVLPRACSCLRQAGVGPPGSSQCILLHTASSTPVTKQAPWLFLVYILIISPKKTSPVARHVSNSDHFKASLKLKLLKKSLQPDFPSAHFLYADVKDKEAISVSKLCSLKQF